MGNKIVFTTTAKWGIRLSTSTRAVFKIHKSDHTIALLKSVFDSPTSYTLMTSMQWFPSSLSCQLHPLLSLPHAYITTFGIYWAYLSLLHNPASTTGNVPSLWKLFPWFICHITKVTTTSSIIGCFQN